LELSFGQQVAIGALLAGLILLAQIRRNIITAPAIRDNISAVLVPYILLFIVLVIFNLGRTAYLLNLEDMAKIEKLEAMLPAPKPSTPTLPSPVDLRGDILELYFRKVNDMLGLPDKTFILLKVKIVNHGPVEATISKVALTVSLGAFKQTCDLVKSVPDAWQIRKRDEQFLNMVYIDTPVGPCLGENADEETYPTGIPRTGWLAFELCSLENIEFPNAEINLHLVDSLGAVHLIHRSSQIYVKNGEVLFIPT
jgi:hypothetical protein